MSRVLLDTSAYSAAMRGHEEIQSVLRHANRIYVNAVVLGELRAGFLGGRRKAEHERALREFLDSPRVEPLPITEDTSELYAVVVNDLREAGTPIPTNDIWIAASAAEHGLRLLTTDEHYRKVRRAIVLCFAAR